MKTATLFLLITFASLFGLSVESGSSYAADATSCVTIDNYSFVNKCAESIKLRWKNQFGNCTTKGCSKQIDPGKTYAIQGHGKVNYDACFLTPGKTCLKVRGDETNSDNTPMLPDQPADNTGSSEIKKKKCSLPDAGSAMPIDLRRGKRLRGQDQMRSSVHGSEKGLRDSIIRQLSLQCSLFGQLWWSAAKSHILLGNAKAATRKPATRLNQPS